MTRFSFLRLLQRSAVLGTIALAAGAAQAKDITLLNVSYDPTRELYVDFNKAFAAHWKAKTGDNVSVKQSHGGSGKQARSVIDGLDADVVTLALAYDIDELHDKAKLIPADWQKRLPHNSSPYTCTIVFLVRKGNPKSIKDWDDLVKPGVSVITPNPKTSRRCALELPGGLGLRAEEDRRRPDEGPGVRGRALQQRAGARLRRARLADHLHRARRRRRASSPGRTRPSSPPRNSARTSSRSSCRRLSILAEPPVTVVDKNVDRKGTREVATAYLQYLYTPEGQDIAAQNYYRPIDPKVAAKYDKQFTKVNLFTIDEVFGGWAKAQKTHFADGGVFDQIYTRK